VSAGIINGVVYTMAWDSFSNSLSKNYRLKRTKSKIN